MIETGIGDVDGWQYHIDHADDHYIIETEDGHTWGLDGVRMERKQQKGGHWEKVTIKEV